MEIMMIMIWYETLSHSLSHPISPLNTSCSLSLQFFLVILLPHISSNPIIHPRSPPPVNPSNAWTHQLLSYRLYFGLSIFTTYVPHFMCPFICDQPSTMFHDILWSDSALPLERAPAERAPARSRLSNGGTFHVNLRALHPARVTRRPGCTGRESTRLPTPPLAVGRRIARGSHNVVT